MTRTRLLLYVLRTHYALKRERRYARALEDQLEGEKSRNQSREDELLTVPMRMMGMYGVATREGPAQPREPLRRQIARPRPGNIWGRQDNLAWADLTEDERSEWPLYLADIERTEGPSDERMPARRREFKEFILQRRAVENGGEIM